MTTIHQSAKNAGERDSRNEPLATLRMQRKCKLYSSVAFGIKCNINSYGGIHGNNTVYGSSTGIITNLNRKTITPVHTHTRRHRTQRAGHGRSKTLAVVVYATCDTGHGSEISTHPNLYPRRQNLGHYRSHSDARRFSLCAHVAALTVPSPSLAHICSRQDPSVSSPSSPHKHS